MALNSQINFKSMLLKHLPLIFIFIISSAFGLSTYALNNYWLNLDQQLDHPRPLIVWLHGCTEVPGEFIELTQILKIADKMNAIIYAPQQPTTRNPLKCWNWFMPGTQKRGGQLAQMINEIDQLIESNKVDRSQIYLGGFSAGGVMATHFAACYPEYFKGIIIHSGAPFKYISPLNILSDRLATSAFQCSDGLIHSSQIKNVIIFQGKQDLIVNYKISEHIMNQVVGMYDLADNGALDRSNVSNISSWIKYHSQTEFLPHYETSSEHQVIELNNGPRIEQIIIPEMGHAWSGGTYGLHFSSPDTLNATEYSFERFLTQSRSKDK